MNTLRLRTLKFAAVIVASVLALGALAYAYFIYSPVIPPHLSWQASNLVVDVDGKPRSYVVYVPAQLPKGGPLLVVLHGTAMTGAMMRQRCRSASRDVKSRARCGCYTPIDRALLR